MRAVYHSVLFRWMQYTILYGGFSLNYRILANNDCSSGDRRVESKNWFLFWFERNFLLPALLNQKQFFNVWKLLISNGLSRRHWENVCLRIHIFYG